MMPPMRDQKSIPSHTKHVTEIRNGVPTVVEVEVFGKRDLEYEKNKQLAQEYIPQRDPLTNELLPGEEQYIGMTKFEVGVCRMADRFAAGDPDTYKYFEDRVLGKAKQQVETTTTAVNFFSWVDQAIKQDPGEVITVTPEPPRIENTPDLLKLIEGL